MGQRIRKEPIECGICKLNIACVLQDSTEELMEEIMAIRGMVEADDG